MTRLSERQLRLLEIGGRYLLALLIVVFIAVAFDTANQVMELKAMIRNGNCSQLVKSGVVKRTGKLS